MNNWQVEVYSSSQNFSSPLLSQREIYVFIEEGISVGVSLPCWAAFVNVIKYKTVMFV